MAGEGGATPGTAGAGLFSSLGTTPRRVASDPDYIYTPASLLDWLKEFKGAIAAADYGPRIIAAGWDSLANANFTEDELIALEGDPPMPRAHARRISNFAAKMQEAMAHGTERERSPRGASTALAPSRVQDVGEAPAFPKVRHGSFPSRDEMEVYMVKLVSWTARWSSSLANALKALVLDWGTSVGALIASLPHAADDVKLVSYIIPTLPSELVRVVGTSSSGLRAIRDLGRPVMADTTTSITALSEDFRSGYGGRATKATLLITIYKWDRDLYYLEAKNETQTERFRVASLKKMVNNIKDVSASVSVFEDVHETQGKSYKAQALRDFIVPFRPWP